MESRNAKARPVRFADLSARLLRAKTKAAELSSGRFTKYHAGTSRIPKLMARPQYEAYARIITSSSSSSSPFSPWLGSFVA
jgi:hypothetical protein